MWSLKEVGMLVMMSWHLVAGVMVVQQEWVVVCPPHYLLSPLVNCWLLAGINVPPLTAWSGTRAAGFRLSGMSEVIKLYGIKKNRLVRMYQRNPLYLWFNGIYSAVHVRDTGTVQTLWKTDRDEFSFITTAGINAASFLSLFSFLSTLCLISSSCHHQ